MKKNKSLPSLFLQGFQHVRGTVAHGIKEFPGYSYLGRPVNWISSYSSFNKSEGLSAHRPFYVYKNLRGFQIPSKSLLFSTLLLQASSLRSSSSRE